MEAKAGAVQNWTVNGDERAKSADDVRELERPRAAHRRLATFLHSGPRLWGEGQASESDRAGPAPNGPTRGAGPAPAMRARSSRSGRAGPPGRAGGRAIRCRRLCFRPILGPCRGRGVRRPCRGSERGTGHGLWHGPCLGPCHGRLLAVTEALLASPSHGRQPGRAAVDATGAVPLRAGRDGRRSRRRGSKGG